MMHSQGEVHRYSVANIITKTSATEAISLTVILYCILLFYTAYCYSILHTIIIIHTDILLDNLWFIFIA